MLHQPLVLQDVEDGAGDGARDGVAAVRVKVFNARIVEALRDRLGRDHCGDGMPVTLLNT